MEMRIAERIRALREERGWSKVELGRRVGGKNPRVTVHRWESGQVVPSPANVVKLASVFGVPKENVDPSGSAYNLTGPRKKQQNVDNSVGPGRIPSSPPTTTTEGPMRDHVRSLEAALEMVPQDRRERFILRVKKLAARTLLQSEEPDVMPGKRRRASGDG